MVQTGGIFPRIPSRLLGSAWWVKENTLETRFDVNYYKHFGHDESKVSVVSVQDHNLLEVLPTLITENVWLSNLATWGFFIKALLFYANVGRLTVTSDT